MKHCHIPMVLITVLFSGKLHAEARDDVGASQHIRDVATALSATNTAWDPIDSAIERLQDAGDSVVPLLELAVRLDWARGEEHNQDVSFQEARAIWVLQRIGSEGAEQALARLLQDYGGFHGQLVTALAIINGIDAAHGVIDRSWYDEKLDEVSGLSRSRVWWKREGQEKYFNE